MMQPRFQWRLVFLAIFLLVSSRNGLVDAFQTAGIRNALTIPPRHVSGHRIPQLNNQQQNDDGNRKEDDKPHDIEESIDDFLDKPFFDPEEVTDDDPAPIRWFANLVQNDYGTAELLYSVVIFVVLVIISQELLRMQLYGSGYVPFQAGVKPGQLF
ncbi:expressed unknown protein [Seminavis robusta]|uniref:Uncharacterized protein n=1 Tax=Seminavis robusta TaxID=568900 RepID=A0A9N8EGZ9_9STRA|nr:expressed unknown protein [Seminavis robusta]|eukprot:Sro922_g220540.1 n/a (156) ;mRNA; r:16065-16532